MSAADILPFFRAWIRNPLRVAAVAPSGPAASSLMVQGINAQTGPVIELGPGTGVFTRALLGRGVRQQDLTLVEYGSEFIPLLQQRFPGARVLWMDAAWLHKEKLFEGAPVGAVVSGLGLLTMPPGKVQAILRGAFFYLRPGGAFYQITYGPHCPVADAILDRLGDPASPEALDLARRWRDHAVKFVGGDQAKLARLRAVLDQALVDPDIAGTLPWRGELAFIKAATQKLEAAGG